MGLARVDGEINAAQDLLLAIFGCDTDMEVLDDECAHDSVSLLFALNSD